MLSKTLIYLISNLPVVTSEMKENGQLSHEAFSKQTVSKLQKKFPEYHFSVVSYQPVKGWANHAIQCWDQKCAYVFR